MAGLFWLALSSAPSAAANCPNNPNNLANGTVADATQVMGNFNNLLTCANNSLAHNGANSDITSLSASPAITSPTMTGTVTGPDLSTWTSSALGNLAKLGIGMTPTNILDVTQNKDGVSIFSLKNSNGGTTAAIQHLLDNGTSSLSVKQNGFAFTSSGIHLQNGSEILASGAGGLTLGTLAAQPIFFAINGANQWNIDSFGDLNYTGFTQSSPAWRLFVDNSSTASMPAAKFASQTALVQTMDIQNVATSGNNIFVDFRTEGSVGTIRGSIDYNRASNVVRYNTTSDVRLKTDIRPADSADALIAVLPVRQFEWRTTGQHVDWGFVAQELYSVYPDAVSAGSPMDVKPSDKRFRAWSYDAKVLIPALVEEIQELRLRVRKLEAAEQKEALNQVRNPSP